MLWATISSSIRFPHESYHPCLLMFPSLISIHFAKTIFTFKSESNNRRFLPLVLVFPFRYLQVRRGVCNRFVNTGFCQYGDACKYFHPKNNQQNTITQGASGVTDNSQSSTVQGNQMVAGSSLPDVVVRDNMGMSWGNLPPSLMPPPEGGYPPLPFVDWG